MKPLEVYSRQGCHLCELLIEELLPLAKGKREVVVHDIDSRADWKSKYNVRIPVIEYDGEVICQYHLDREALAPILKSDEPNT